MRELFAVPFVPQTTPGREAFDAAQQLSATIAKWRSEGFEFSHLENITTLVNNGCIASLFGPAQSVVTVQVAILARVPPVGASGGPPA